MFKRLPLLDILLGAVGPLVAQSTTAELFGHVHDPSGLPVNNTAVELANVVTGRSATTQTAPDGSYQFLGILPGDYRILARKERFNTSFRNGITLGVGDRFRVDIDLQVGPETQMVIVTAAPPLLQASRGTVSFVVDQKRVSTLPLDGRNFVPLIALSTGVNLPPGSLLPRINGSRPRVSEYIYDGISVLQPEPGQVAFYPVIDAIEEFRVETNSYSAEYGRSNGGVIIVSQKSGSNEFHGTFFEFFRNEKLNARNLFATSATKPRFRRNQFGFVLGGPVRTNETFFFADWQATRLNTGVVRTSTVPAVAQRQGIFTTPNFDPATTRRTESGFSREPFPNNTIPPSRVDQAASALIDRYPYPNSTAVANNYQRVGNDDTLANQFDGRVDRYFGTANRVFGRFSFLCDRANPTTPLPDGSGNLTSGVIGNTLTRAESVAVEHSWTGTTASVNQLRFGYTRRMFDRESLRSGKSEADNTIIPNIPVSSFSDVLPTFDIVGFQQLGPPPNANAAFATSVAQFIDSYSRVSGRHTVKAGADIRFQTLDVLQPPSPTGNFQFTSIFTSGVTATGAVAPNTGNSFASFLLGQTGRFTIDSQPEMIKPRATVAEFFLQDDWRISRRLSWNLGVRYTLNLPSTVKEDRGAVFNLDSERLDFLGRDGFSRAARNLERLNLAPRVGFALQLLESLVVRSGYGLTWIEQAGITTPFTTPLFPYIQTLGQQSLDNLNPAFILSKGPSVGPQRPNADSGLGQGVFAVQRDNGSGYAQQWNLSLQKTFGQNWSVEAGYLGSKLTRLGVPDANLNQLSVEQLALGSALTQQVPNPYFGQVPAGSLLGSPTIARGQLLRPYPRFTTVALYRNNIGHSTYHSLQSRIEKRFSRGLTFTVAYTFSRLIDDAGAVFDSAVLTGPVTNFQVSDSFNKRLEKDVSTGNVPHILSSGFVYEVPIRGGLSGFFRGWRVGGIVRTQSGSPIAVTQATNLNAFAGFGVQRPNRNADPSLPTDERSVGRWFNVGAFTQAPQYTIGNSSRNPVVGPGYKTVDIMLGRMFALTECLRTELRAEAFNVTNTPPLANPNGNFGNAAFGTITTALDPRVFELVLKVSF